MHYRADLKISVRRHEVCPIRPHVRHVRLIFNTMKLMERYRSRPI